MAVDEGLLRKVQDLGDLDLAALLCLISREHCIVSTEPSSLDHLVAELQLVADRTFNLTSAVVDCTPQTTLDDLASSIQLPSSGATNTTTPRSPSPLRPRNNDTYFPYQTPRPGSSNAHHHHHLHGAHGHAPVHGHGSHAPPLAPLRALTPIAAAASQSVNSGTTTPQMANVVLAKNLDRAPKAVQIQCLELLRTRRIFTRTSVQTAPKQFLFVAVLGADSIGGGVEGEYGSGRLTKHLNDFLYIAHWHDPDDGFAHLEEQEEQEREAEDATHVSAGAGERYDNDGGEYDDAASSQSASSVVRRPRSRSTAARTSTPPSTIKTDPWGGVRVSVSYKDTASAREKSTPNNNHNDTNTKPSLPPSLFRTETDIPALAAAAEAVSLDVEVLRYQMNIVSFLRMHRAVAYAGGVEPLATRHMTQLVRCLAALHGLDYATPSLVGLAARKVYPHRLRLVADFAKEREEESGGGGGEAGGGLEHERSMQWGSDLDAVGALLEGVGPEDVIDDVLGMVAAPL